jgi:hypothetical protein
MARTAPIPDSPVESHIIQVQGMTVARDGSNEATPCTGVRCSCGSDHFAVFYQQCEGSGHLHLMCAKCTATYCVPNPETQN